MNSTMLNDKHGTRRKYVTSAGRLPLSSTTDMKRIDAVHLGHPYVGVRQCDQQVTDCEP